MDIHSDALFVTLQMDRREPDDPCPYLFAIWEEGTLQNDHMVHL